MKKYKNKKTGRVVEANGILTGKNWEEVSEETAAAKKNSKKAKAEEAETE